jgi:hypothetical protein
MRHGILFAVSVGAFLALAGQAPAQAPQQLVMPGAEKIVLLVRNSLITLNDALRTGNYTVLRDIGAPGFRAANSAARLSQIFASLAAQNVDLSAVAVITPQLAEQPALDQEKGMLLLKGYFPGEPVRISFELLYQAVDGQWRLFGIAVQPGSSQTGSPSAEASGSTASKRRTEEAA